MLAGGESYGWALFGELRARGLAIERSLAYRDLRELERDGLVTSRWTQSDAGPQRRSYRLTGEGRAALDDLAANVRAVWELHEAFVRARQGAQEAGEDALTGLPDAPGPVRPGRELLAAWLLLLLDGRASYGYELHHELDARAIRMDPATLYRVLRKLEHAGWLESRWMDPTVGPRRRLYRLTARGRRNLGEVAALTTRIRDTHGAFLRAYERAAPLTTRGAPRARRATARRAPT